MFWFILGLCPGVNAQISNLTDTNYYATINKATKLIIVDFYFDGCKPCIAMNPIMDSLARESSNILSVFKMNIFQTKTYRTLGLDEYPSYVFYKNGVKLLTQTGMTSKAYMKKLIDTYK
jgi:thioredoxin 1